MLARVGRLYNTPEFKIWGILKSKNNNENSILFVIIKNGNMHFL
jgi:hypothetical protein